MLVYTILAMSVITGLLHRNSEQHIEFGKSRLKRDNCNLEKLINWFDIHEPYNKIETNLKCVASGLTSAENDCINCDDAEDVGRAIHFKLGNISVKDKIKRTDQIRALEKLRPGIDGKTTYIDPALLPIRLTALLGPQDDVSEKFDFALTPEPTALFEYGIMLKASKSQLTNALLDKVVYLLRYGWSIVEHNCIKLLGLLTEHMMK